MATIRLAPKALTPVYNNVISAVSSTNVNKDNFQYIFDIMDAGTSTRIARVKLPANPDSFGVHDAQRILESQVSLEVLPTLTGWTNASSHFKKFNINYGEEFTFTWNFEDNFFSSGNVGFTSSTTQHYFQVGDLVLIDQNDTGATNSDYDGVHTITSVPNNYAFVIDQAFGVSTAPEAGTAVNSDFSKTLFTGLTSSTGNYVFNGALSHEAFRTYDPQDYILGTGATGSLMTSLPNGYLFDLDTRAYLFAFQTGGTNAQYLRIDLSNGNTYRIENSNPTGQTLAVGVGTWNINNSGFGNIIDGTITSYTAQTENAASAATSQALTFEVYENCAGRPYTQMQLVGMDRLGSVVGFNFDLAHTKTDNIARSEYKGIVGSYNGSTWGYNSHDRGRKVYNVDVAKSYTVNSDFIKEELVEYLAELYSSPEVFLVDESGNWLPIIVTDTAFEFKFRATQKLISYKLTFQLANADQVQRG